MFLFFVALSLLVGFVVLVLVAGISVAAIAAAVVVGIAILATLVTAALVLIARRIDHFRGRSSRAQVLHDIRAVERRLLGSAGR